MRPVVFVFLGLVGLWVGSSLFSYFTYNIVPDVRIEGLEQGGVYKGTMHGSIHANTGYKIASVSITIDDKPFEVEGVRSVRAKEFSIPFELDTTELSQGRHLLKIESVDSSYNANRSSEQIEFFVDNVPLKAAFLQQELRVDQGRTLHPKFKVNKTVVNAKVKVFSKTYDCYPDTEGSTVYESFIPIDCEQSSDEYIMSLDVTDKVGNTVTLANAIKINEVSFPKQKGFYVPPEKLNDEKEISMNNKILSEALEKWLSNSPKNKLWSGPFEQPTVVRRISTPYGEIRITPEKGRYLHRAIDIVNTPKSVVWASQNGKVIIKDRYLMTGNTIVLDHGLGVFTKYFHLDDFADIEVGDLVKKGAPVGRLGMTGYANGYHLHWELTINGVPVDPLEWTKTVF